MFALLTDYLLQYRKLSIPSIGKFELREQPARLVFAEKQIYPPKYDIVFSEVGSIEPELIDFISQRQHLDRRTAEERLSQMGMQLKEKLSGSTLKWEGFGELSGRRDSIHFTPALEYVSLTPVHAEMVIRENVAHTVLVGDREFQKTTVMEDAVVRKKFPLAYIIAFIVLILALLFIGWHFYTNGWTFSSGSRWNGL